VLDDGAYSGVRLANVPTNAASLWGRYVIDRDWTVGGGVFYQGERAGDIGDTFQLPAYARVDLMAAYALRSVGPDTTLQLNLNNVFDELYYTGSHQFVADWIALGAPRNVSVTLRAAF
jgi:iron complex outermembrane receptor protein